MRKLSSVLFVASLVLVSRYLYAIDTDSGTYGDINDFFNSLYGTDANAGSTAFPVLNIPMGGKSEGMAGAFSAVCDDISFIDWNPAGSSMLTKTELAVFHNNWIADTKIESAVFGTRLKRMGIAASAKWLYTPFTEYDEWGDRASKGYYSEMVGALNAAYNFFPGYYYPGFSLGVTLKGFFRATPDFSEYSSASQSSSGFAVDVGMLTRINFLKFYDSRDKNMSFALVLRNMGPPVQDEALPGYAVAGFSWKPFRPLLVSFDATLPVNIMDIELSEKPFFALGLSAAVTPFLSMRAGGMLKAGASRITLGTSLEIGATAIEINYTLDLTTQMQPLNRVTVGARIDLGDGGRSAAAKQVDANYLAGLDAYTAGDDEKALEFFNAALAINPYFDPALEGVAAIKRYRALQQRIRKMESFE